MGRAPRSAGPVPITHPDGWTDGLRRATVWIDPANDSGAAPRHSGRATGVRSRGRSRPAGPSSAARRRGRAATARPRRAARPAASKASRSARISSGSMPCGSQPVRVEMVKPGRTDRAAGVRRPLRASAGFDADGLVAVTETDGAPVGAARCSRRPRPGSGAPAWAGRGRRRSRWCRRGTTPGRRPRRLPQLERLVEAVAAVGEVVAEGGVLGSDQPTPTPTTRRPPDSGRCWRGCWRARAGCAWGPRGRSCRARSVVAAAAHVSVARGSNRYGDG